MHGTIMLLLFAPRCSSGWRTSCCRCRSARPTWRSRGWTCWLLHVHVQRADPAGQLPHPGRGGVVRLVAYLPAGQRDLLARRRRRHVGHGSDAFGLRPSVRVNFVTTIFCMRAPGMTMFRMPIFTWNALLTSMMVLIAFPVLAAALLVLEIDRRMGAHVFDASSGGADLVAATCSGSSADPEVYILAIPFFGIATDRSRCSAASRCSATRRWIAATVGITGLSMTVWAHQAGSRTGAVLLPFFSLHAVPDRDTDRDQVLQLDRHHVARPAHLRAADAVLDRVPGHVPVRRTSRGVILASPPLDFAVSDSYFLVAHFHYVLAGRCCSRCSPALLLVAEDDRQDAEQPDRQDPVLVHVHRLPHDVPGPATGWASRACPGASPTTRSCPGT